MPLACPVAVAAQAEAASRERTAFEPRPSSATEKSDDCGRAEHP